MSAWAAAREPSRTSVARLIADLLGSRPAFGAPTGERAEWFARKAEVFGRIAQVNEADSDVVRAAEARAMSDQARARAAELQAQMAAEAPAPDAVVGEQAREAEHDADQQTWAQYERDVDRAVQLATHDEIAYGPTGDVQLLRDPLDILAERDHDSALSTSNANVIEAGVFER